MHTQQVGWRHRLNFYGSEYGHMAGSCECGDEPSDSMKCKEFIDYMRTCQLLNKKVQVCACCSLLFGG
jgi:hypothetical protein